jgi:hypothetical protein
MPRVKRIESEVLFPAICDLLKSNQTVRMTVTGDSMMPFLREDNDSVELSPISFKDLHFGQIVLIRRTSGQYILHRVIFKKKTCFYMAGDAQLWIEGPLLPEQLVAAVNKIWRGSSPVSQNNLLYRILIFLWWLRLPVKFMIKKPLKLLKTLLK